MINKKWGGEKKQSRASSNAILNCINHLESWRTWVGKEITDCEWVRRGEQLPQRSRCSGLEVLQPLPFCLRNQRCRTNVILKYYSPPSILLYYSEQLIIVHPRKDLIKVLWIVLLFSLPLKTGILPLEVISNDTSFRLPVKEWVCNRIYTPFLSHQQWGSFKITNSSPKTPVFAYRYSMTMAL